MRTLMLPLLLLIGAAAPAAEPAPDEVLIYRCTDAQGRLALQDFPCANGEEQQVRTMIRPQDPPPPPPSANPPTAASSAPAVDTPAETIVRVPARPMYECVTADGERYLSDDGDGNPRPAPVWGWGAPHAGPAPGVPPGPRSAGERRAAGIASPGMSTSPGPSLTAPAPRPGTAPPPRPRPPRHGHPFYGTGGSDGWIRDTCHPLPQNQVCTLLGSRRTEIRRRIFNAQPTERSVLREEDRDITARLNQDCGIQ
ncbi:hypothetical protein ACW7G2_12805 [Luteimonas sp. A277]